MRSSKTILDWAACLEKYCLLPSWNFECSPFPEQWASQQGLNQSDAAPGECGSRDVLLKGGNGRFQLWPSVPSMAAAASAACGTETQPAGSRGPLVSESGWTAGLRWSCAEQKKERQPTSKLRGQVVDMCVVVRLDSKEGWALLHSLKPPVADRRP